MKARKAVAVIRGGRCKIHYVSLFEGHAGNPSGYWPNVEDLNLTKTSNVGHKPFHARANINMLLRVSCVYFLCDIQILPKIFATRRAALLGPIMQAREKRQTTGVGSAEASEIAHISRQPAQRTKHSPWINSKLRAHNGVEADGRFP